LRRTDNLSGETHLIILGDSDHTFVDFGTDGKSVEERDLRRVHTSGSGWDDDINGSDGTELGGSLDFVGFEFRFEFED